MQSKDIDDCMVIRLARDWQATRGALGAVEGLIAQGVPEKLAWHKVMRLVDRGLLEYGTSACWAWPTPAGLALLEESCG